MERQTNSISKTSFGTATVFTGYLIWRCMKAPNATRHIEHERIRDTLNTKPFFLLSALYRTAFLAHTIWQGVVCMDRRFARNNPKHSMNETLLTWNKISTMTFLFIWTGSLIRILAFKQLGEKFTFELHEPDRLKTDGLYRYVQHPSYSGGVVAVVGAAFWFFRTDGVLAGVLPEKVLRYGSVLNWVVPGGVLMAAAVGIPLRVADEERMLKGKFDKEWEVWHRRTARFVPFLF